MLNYKKPSFWVIVVAVIACAVVLVCFATNPATADIDFPPDTQWVEGIGFVELAPNEEIKSPSEIIVDADNSTIQFAMTYSRPGLTLEYGLQTEDGIEYSREIVGGTDVYTIKDIPNGTYFLFVRNSGDYSDLPAYQDKSESFNATGAINYYLENTQSIEN